MRARVRVLSATVRLALNVRPTPVRLVRRAQRSARIPGSGSWVAGRVRSRVRARVRLRSAVRVRFRVRGARRSAGSGRQPLASSAAARPCRLVPLPGAVPRGAAGDPSSCAVSSPRSRSRACSRGAPVGRRIAAGAGRPGCGSARALAPGCRDCPAPRLRSSVSFAEPGAWPGLAWPGRDRGPDGASRSWSKPWTSSRCSSTRPTSWTQTISRLGRLRLAAAAAARRVLGGRLCFVLLRLARAAARSVVGVIET